MDIFFWTQTAQIFVENIPRRNRSQRNDDDNNAFSYANSHLTCRVNYDSLQIHRTKSGIGVSDEGTTTTKTRSTRILNLHSTYHLNLPRELRYRTKYYTVLRNRGIRQRNAQRQRYVQRNSIHTQTCRVNHGSLQLHRSTESEYQTKERQRQKYV